MDFSAVTGFEWDEGNGEKNWRLHHVSWTEAEEAFFQQPQLISPDLRHSVAEHRFYLLGRTVAYRWMFVVFTVRGSNIRVISARDMSKIERRVYEEAVKDDSGF